MLTRTRSTTTRTGERVEMTTARLDGRSVLSAVRAFYSTSPSGPTTPNSMGTVGGVLPGQRKRRLAQEGPITVQGPHGSAHPGTVAGAAGPGVVGRGRTHPHRRAPRRRQAHRTRRPVHHHRRRDAAPTATETETTDRIWAEHPDGGPRRNLSFHPRRLSWHPSRLSVHPGAVKVARQHGLDLARATPTSIEDVVRGGELIVAVCDNAHEELDPTLPRLHWSIPDRVGRATAAAFEDAYTDIARRVQHLADRQPDTRKAS